jgi:hypothetical protein
VQKITLLYTYAVLYKDHADDERECREKKTWIYKTILMGNNITYFCLLLLSCVILNILPLPQSGSANYLTPPSDKAIFAWWFWIF